MAAYLLLEAKVSDLVAFETYRKLEKLSLAKYQGRYLAGGGTAEVLEGNWSKPEHLVVAEFDSVEQAKKFYNSPEYGAAREARKDAATMNLLVVPG
ncbi:DUF1330 domain-containing protein [Propionivibrio sp.]|uniref:DUF1330 domain-containing protein n=1 Tax=Propionivibrio sp. TaxID=2212460 RepID=UPI003BF2B229